MTPRQTDWRQTANRKVTVTVTVTDCDCDAECVSWARELAAKGSADMKPAVRVWSYRDMAASLQGRDLW
jgi:hypothetical protein